MMRMSPCSSVPCRAPEEARDTQRVIPRPCAAVHQRDVKGVRRYARPVGRFGSRSIQFTGAEMTKAGRESVGIILDSTSTQPRSAVGQLEQIGSEGSMSNALMLISTVAQLVGVGSDGDVGPTCSTVAFALIRVGFENAEALVPAKSDAAAAAATAMTTIRPPMRPNDPPSRALTLAACASGGHYPFIRFARGFPGCVNRRRGALMRTGRALILAHELAYDPEIDA